MIYSGGGEVKEEIEYDFSKIKGFMDCALSYRCPLKWDDLKKTDNENVRFCTECMENVYHVENLIDFKQKVKEKKCISIQKYDDNGEEEILMGTPLWSK